MFVGFLCITAALLADHSYAHYEHYRLPKTITPISYNLSVLTHLNPPDNFRFEGEVKITLNIIQDSRNITLNAKNLTIDEKKIVLRDLKTSKFNCISRIETNSEFDYYIMHVCDELKANQIYELSIPFAAPLNEELDCYYKSYYIDKSTNETRWSSSTLFEPAFARRAFPCFDEPDFKAKFTISLGHHKKYNALSNMPLRNTRVNSAIKDYVWSDFEESLPMSTYIVAYTVNDFVSIQPGVKRSDNLQLKLWTSADNINKSHYTIEFGAVALQYLEDLYGTKLPLKKLDLLLLNQFNFAGMENWGLITYKDIGTMYDPKKSTLATKQEAASLIAHELVHQWFGNLVTMKWWTDLWLNEAFANYVATLIIKHIYPEWKHDDDQIILHQNRFLVQDAFVTSHPISRTVTTPRDIEMLFDTITYSKGNIVVRMMHLFIGNEVFHKGLVKYFQRFAYKNSVSNDLWNAFNDVESENNKNAVQKYNVKTVMGLWLQQPGYPLVTVSRVYNNNTARITQKRFLLHSSKSTQPAHQCWWIPLSYTTQSKSDFHSLIPKQWLECSQGGVAKPHTIDMPGKNEWVLFNLQYSGLYRVNYDQENWDLIIKTLNEGDFERIHILNRVQLIDDAFALARIGEMDYYTVIRLIGYLRRERDLKPWEQASLIFESFVRVIENRPEKKIFENFLRKLFTPIYKDQQGSNVSLVGATDQNEIRLRRLVILWACQLNIDGCLPKAHESFKKWQLNRNNLPLEFQSVVLAEEIKNGDQKQWQNLFELLQKTSDEEERIDLLQALSFSKDEKVLQKYFEYIATQNSTSPDEDALVIKTFIMNIYGINIIKDKLLRPPLRLNKHMLPNTIELLSMFMTTQEDYNSFKSFTNNEKILLKQLNMDQELKNSNEYIQMNIDWMKNGRFNEFINAMTKFNLT